MITADAVLAAEPECAPEAAAAWGLAIRALASQAVPSPSTWAPRWIARAEGAHARLTACGLDLGPATERALEALATRRAALDGATFTRVAEGLDLATLAWDAAGEEAVRVEVSAGDPLVHLVAVLHHHDAAVRAIAFEAAALAVTEGGVARVEAYAIVRALELCEGADRDARVREHARDRLTDAISGRLAARLRAASLGRGIDLLSPGPARVLLRGCMDDCAGAAPDAPIWGWSGAVGAALLALVIGGALGARWVAAGEERRHTALHAPPARPADTEKWAALGAAAVQALDDAVSAAARSGLAERVARLPALPPAPASAEEVLDRSPRTAADLLAPVALWSAQREALISNTLEDRIARARALDVAAGPAALAQAQAQAPDAVIVRLAARILVRALDG